MGVCESIVLFVNTAVLRVLAILCLLVWCGFERARRLGLKVLLAVDLVLLAGGQDTQRSRCVLGIAFRLRAHHS